jgi:hypothetical protein
MQMPLAAIVPCYQGQFLEDAIGTTLLTRMNVLLNDDGTNDEILGQ